MFLQGQQVSAAAAAVEAPVQESIGLNEDELPDPSSAEDFALTLPDMSKVLPSASSYLPPCLRLHLGHQTPVI